ncbi:hypothetical protein D3C76_534660 [compost metagenome]
MPSVSTVYFILGLGLEVNVEAVFHISLSIEYIEFKVVTIYFETDIFILLPFMLSLIVILAFITFLLGFATITALLGTILSIFAIVSELCPL